MYSRSQTSLSDTTGYPRQQSPLLAYFNYLGEVPDNELCEVLQKNMNKFLEFLRNVLSPHEIINTICLLLRVLKLDVDVNIKTTIISVIFTMKEFSIQLNVFIIYLPFERITEYQDSVERFWLAIFELIQELIKLKDPLYKELVVKIYLNCKHLISYMKTERTLTLPEIPESITNDLQTLVNLNDLESMNFNISQEEIEKYNVEETVVFKNLKEFKTFEEYFRWYYLQIRREFISILSKAIKKLHEDIISDKDNNEFQIISNCTGKITQNGLFAVTLGTCKQKYFENEEITPGYLVCFSYNNYQTYTIGVLLNVFVERNSLLVNLINTDLCLISKKFSTAIFKLYFYKTTESILQSLKISLFKDLPFDEYLLFGRNDCIKRPKYLQEPSEFNFDDFKFKPYDFNTWPTKEYFQLNTEQYLAFQHLVTNELALLTGYPGSGKSQVVLKFIEFLLKNKQIWHQNNAGPILILSYTNKSLDTFMEKILPLTDSFVRLGYQTASEKLKTFIEPDLSNISSDIRKKNNNIGGEIKRLAEEAQAVFKNGGLIRMKYLGISKISNQSFYDKLMANNDTERLALMNEILGVKEENPLILSDVKPVDSYIYYVTVSGLQARHDENSSYLQWRLTYKECHKKFYPRNGIDYDNIQNLTGNELWGLYFYLVDQYANQIDENLNIMQEQKQILRYHLTEQDNFDHSRLLKQKMIAGVTFSGAGLRKDLIDALNSSIVIVEETSYIEHYYILGIIPKSCKHLILIGDITPEIIESEIRNNHSLMDILLEYKYPIKPLNKQFRMKSEIATILRKLFYLDMEDDESIRKIPDVPGIPKPVFFINHCVENDDNECMNWKRAVINSYEIKYLLQLVKFLLSRGVPAESVTILTTTKLQAFEFDKVIKENDDEGLQKIKSWAIDDFQSLENDIILLSLAGINDQYKSFFTTEDKLRVGLSRSKQGFYMIGNMEKLCKQNDIWVSVRQLLEDKGYIGNALPISCPLHIGKECTSVEKAEDFLNLESHFVTCSFKFNS